MALENLDYGDLLREADQIRERLKGVKQLAIRTRAEVYRDDTPGEFVVITDLKLLGIYDGLAYWQGPEDVYRPYNPDEPRVIVAHDTNQGRDRIFLDGQLGQEGFGWCGGYVPADDLIIPEK